MLSSLETDYVCERKFSGHVSALPRAMAVVGAACAHDGEFPEGVVNSIYFETPSLRSYWEKANGDNLKTKLRLRWYGLDESLGAEVPAFLEVKGRIGGARHKRRIEVSVPRPLLLDTPFEAPPLRDFILASLGRLEIPSPLSWFPACQISYSRRRYVDAMTGSRISIDWDIRASRFNYDLFPLGRPIALDRMVCEFKNQFGAPPRWADELALCGLAYGSFSKFGECVARLSSGAM